MEGRPRHCPHLGLKHTKAIRFSSPTEEHRCYIFGEPLPIRVDQRSFCLSENYAECPRFSGQEPPPVPSQTRALRRPGQPSRLAVFWQSLGRGQRILYVSLLGVFLALLAAWALIVGVVLPRRQGSVVETPVPSTVPTSQPVATTAVPATATEPPTFPPPTTVRPSDTPRATETVAGATETAAASTSSPAPSTQTPVPPTGTPEAPSATPQAPTKTPSGATNTPVAVVPTATSAPENMWLTLYFLGPNRAYKVPVSRQTDFTLGVARRAFELMSAGPRVGSNLLRSVPAGMQLNAIWVEGATIYIDLAQSFESLGAGESEAMAVVLAMTEFSTVERVQFLVNGAEVGLPGSGNSGPVARPGYVNFENPYNLTPEESVALTLFLATPDGQYLFPIVRRVASTDATARAALEEMIKGPSSAYTGVAISPLASGTQINSLSRDGNTIVVDFNAAFQASPNVDLAIRSVIFAMAGLTADSHQGINSVRISVEGAAVGFYSVYDYLINPEW